MHNRFRQQLVSIYGKKRKLYSMWENQSIYEHELFHIWNERSMMKKNKQLYLKVTQ